MVYFIGAGPGAVDLITVRGQELLKKADVVIYAGSLVNPELLKCTKPECKIYNSASMTLDEIIDVFVREYSPDKILVRLHTGDPSIYGAIKSRWSCWTSIKFLIALCPESVHFAVRQRC